MTGRKNGGPAFPNDADNTPERPIYDGMMLLDYFAAHALVGLLSTGKELYVENNETHEREKLDAHGMAKFAYILADAMIAERKKSSDEQTKNCDILFARG